VISHYVVISIYPPEQPLGTAEDIRADKHAYTQQLT
jgi:hypothetical protein